MYSKEELCRLEQSELVKLIDEGQLVYLPCKQYTTIHYILDNRVYIGWYLARVGETTHLIMQDKIEMGVCWATDGFWFFTAEEAEKALSGINSHRKEITVC